MIDLVVIEVELGAKGATLTNTTIDETSGLIKYNGTWVEESDPLFLGGSSIYSATAGDSFSFDFEGGLRVVASGLHQLCQASEAEYLINPASSCRIVMHLRS